MRLTKTARKELREILRHARRAQSVLHDDAVAVCKRRKQATTTLDYTRKDGAVLAEVNKLAGSDLCGIDFAIRGLEAFLESHD